MGTLSYAGELFLPIPDRVLAHLQPVIGAKLRRSEGFFLTLTVELGSQSLWLHPTIPLVFSYTSDERQILNRKWLDLLTSASNSGAGLTLIPDPGPSVLPVE